MGHEDHKDYLVHQELLAPKVHQGHKEFQEERGLSVHQGKQGHQEEVSQMVTFAEFVRVFWTIKWQNLFMNCEDHKVCLDRASQGQQERLAKLAHQVFLDQWVLLANEVSWAYLGTKDLKDLKVQGVSLVQKEPKELKDLVYKVHREFLVHKVSKDRLETVGLGPMDNKVPQGQEDTLVSEARMVPLVQWVHASNVLQS